MMKAATRHTGFQRIMYNSLALFYSAFLIYIFFFARRRWRVFPSRIVNLVPFRDKLYYVHVHGTKFTAENSEFYKDLFGNILVFLPLPFLLNYLFHIKSYLKLFLCCVGISISVEIIQYILNIGVADVDDLILNTVGSLLGLFSFFIARSLFFSKNSLPKI